ncbi:GNAT family N-acetyltransferase [Pontibacillus sp. ALD_SL1]|uniref:GNAT family N-acetyltransferase n=1 Tax=Pontibacillus sp. ALD_SL1 TaxID=2777185 RepID=UPI001A975968|nr:GNAT family protein [Pontibacillus sp. ALD_SL1]QST01162.1 GNAT family N-acetyltransferase [Pontibacillus sp. ALD_SL1]
MEIEDIYGNLPTLETDRLLLRRITSEDLDDMYEYVSNEEVTKYVTWEAHRSLSDTKEFIKYALSQYEDKDLSPWGIEYKSNGKFIGTIDFVSWEVNHHVAEVGFAISQDYWGKGITTEAVNELIKFGFTHMNLVRIQARCLVENRGSECVMEKAGMSFEGILRKSMLVKGKHHDLKIYSILKEEFFSKHTPKVENESL